MVAQIKRIKKTKSNFFSRILLLGSSSPPSQLFPNPFNWSPNTVFYRYLNIGRSNQKKKTKYISLQMLLLLLLGEGLARGKLANVHLALARLSFLAGHLGQEVKIIASKIIFPRKVQHLSDRQQYHFRSPSCP